MDNMLDHPQCIPPPSEPVLPSVKVSSPETANALVSTQMALHAGERVPVNLNIHGQLPPSQVGTSSAVSSHSGEASCKLLYSVYFTC